VTGTTLCTYDLGRKSTELILKLFILLSFKHNVVKDLLLAQRDTRSNGEFFQSIAVERNNRK
jgi:hypothetical protein